jgi:hypothetical protein
MREESGDVRDGLDIRNLIARITRLTDNRSSMEEYRADATREIDVRPAYVGHEGIGRRVQEVLDEAGVPPPRHIKEEPWSSTVPPPPR